LHVKFAQSLRYQDDNTETAKVRPAGGIQNHTTPDINISEALRASGVRQRKTIANLTLDLRREALVVRAKQKRCDRSNNLTDLSHCENPFCYRLRKSTVVRIVTANVGRNRTAKSVAF
jgi:hypothetical protein